MTAAIAIHLFQAVYTGHGYFGRFWEITTYISVMVNGHYIHFYKNRYNKVNPILLVHLFLPPCASKCEWMEQPLSVTYYWSYIIISKSKCVLNSASQSYSFSHCTLRSLSPNPVPKSYRVLVLELQARGKKNKRNGWEKKDSNIHNN